MHFKGENFCFAVKDLRDEVASELDPRNLGDVFAVERYAEK
jgi:hypothetical protein